MHNFIMKFNTAEETSTSNMVCKETQYAVNVLSDLWAILSSERGIKWHRVRHVDRSDDKAVCNNFERYRGKGGKIAADN